MPRSRRRCGRRAAAIAAALALAAPAYAEVLVSNIGQSATHNRAFSGLDSAQVFRTGAGTGGYTLESVEVKFHSASASDLRVRLHQGTPTGTVVATLTHPSSLAAGNLTFTAPAGTTLEASTTYVLVLDTTTTGAVSTTNLTGEDPGGAPGWSIMKGQSSGGGRWRDGRRLLIRVNGSAAPPAVTIAAGTSPVTEGTAATFTVTADPAPSADLTVNLSVSEAQGSDYVAAGDEGSKTVTITSGSTTATYSVTTQGDSADEPNGSVRVAVASGAGYTVGSESSALVLVNDDDAPPPTVTNVAISSTPSHDADDSGTPETYGLDAKIRVRLTFSEAVTVTGTPRLTIKMDPAYGEFPADFESGSGAANLVFAYMVVAQNISTGGVAVLANTLELNGGTIRAGTADAVLGHAGLAHDAAHKVDYRLESVAPPPPP
ncbi:MAG: hypothetical protein F4Y02_05340, partial [Chloroflexi bacterium]|nr:hypothetical protein [Chloroflexota bacterium]